MNLEHEFTTRESVVPSIQPHLHLSSCQESISTPLHLFLILDLNRFTPLPSIHDPSRSKVSNPLETPVFNLLRHPFLIHLLNFHLLQYQTMKLSQRLSNKHTEHRLHQPIYLPSLLHLGIFGSSQQLCSCSCYIYTYEKLILINALDTWCEEECLSGRVREECV